MVNTERTKARDNASKFDEMLNPALDREIVAHSGFEPNVVRHHCLSPFVVRSIDRVIHAGDTRTIAREAIFSACPIYLWSGLID